MHSLAVDASRSDEKPGSRDNDHDRAENDERQPGGVGKLLAGGGDAATGQCAQTSTEQIEALDQKSKRHHRDRGAHPGEKGALVGGVIAEIPDHDCLPHFPESADPRVALASVIPGQAGIRSSLIPARPGGTPEPL